MLVIMKLKTFNSLPRAGSNVAKCHNHSVTNGNKQNESFIHKEWIILMTINWINIIETRLVTSN